LDVFVTPTESESFCRIDTKKCFISFSYGDKIPVKTQEYSIGGNAANNAVGARRLGVKSSAVLTLGEDEVGDRIVKTLETEGVDTTYLIRQPATESNYSTIISYQGERTIFSYKVPRSYKFPINLPSAPWVYLTSMGESFRPFYNHVIEWLKKNPETRLAFNPGSRQIRAGVDSIKDVLGISHIVYINRKEAEIITGMEGTKGKEKDLLKNLSSLGPKISIITDGGGGAYVFDGERFIHAGILPLDSHERTGAGDAFGSGYMAATIKGKTLEEALTWGTVNSASVIGYTGGQRGLLKEAELPEWLERARSSEMEIKEF
jgi:ribokinase